MGKKIVLLTGSPRKQGNSAAMAEAFQTAAEGLGHTVTRFDTAFLKVGGCRACESCYKTGRPCVFDDDFNRIAPAVLEADAVVFASPLYWYTIPAQLKAVIDRMYCFMVGGKQISGKKYAVLACCEEEDGTVLEGITTPIRRSAELMGWECLGEILAPGVLNPGDITKTDALRAAAALAETL